MTTTYMSVAMQVLQDFLVVQMEPGPACLDHREHHRIQEIWRGASARLEPAGQLLHTMVPS